MSKQWGPEMEKYPHGGRFLLFSALSSVFASRKLTFHRRRSKKWRSRCWRMEIDVRLRGPRLYESRKHAGLSSPNQSQRSGTSRGHRSGQWKREPGAETPAHLERNARHVTRVKSLGQKVGGGWSGCHDSGRVDLSGATFKDKCYN